MAKHTPGPWGVRCDTPEVFAGPAKENTPVILRGYRLHIANCNAAYDSGDIEHDEAMANAHLIAAAPEMYEALEAVEAHLRTTFPPYPPSETPYERVRKALSLARKSE